MKRRRWLRYSLRTMLVVVLVLSVWLGWMANKAAKQRRAVALVGELGGKTYYNYGYGSPEAFRAPEKRPTVPNWLRDLCGDDWFYDVGWVAITRREFAEGQLAQFIDDLQGTYVLNLHATSFDDEELKNLRKLARLRWLRLGYTNLSDEGLRHVGECHTLERLWLYGTDITDDGLAHLRGHADLKWLSLDTTRVTDGGLVHLRTLRNLEYLWLGGTSITDAGLSTLGNLKSLRVVDLGHTDVTDAGITRLHSELPHLVIGTSFRNDPPHFVLSEH